MPFWRASGPATSFDRGEGLAVYYRIDSGDAHLVQSEILWVLDLLADTPLTASDISASLVSRVQDPNAVSPAVVEGWLAELEVVGLVVRA